MSRSPARLRNFARPGLCGLRCRELYPGVIFGACRTNCQDTVLDPRNNSTGDRATRDEKVETVITISGADKAGALAGLVVFLTRKGYTVKGQKVSDLPSGARLLKIRLGLAQVNKEMAAQFPDIVALVRAYGGAFGLEGRAQALLDAGKKIGAFNYRKEWSFGNPLRMPAALRRALVPALEKFAQVEATDTRIVLPDSPFCAAGSEINCCDFIT